MAGRQTVWGWHTVGHLLRSRPEHVLSVTLQSGRDDVRARDVLELAGVAGVHVDNADRASLDKRAGGAPHQGVIASVRERPELGENDLDELLADNREHLLLILDGVQDPHNLGACLRVADGAGATAVIVPRRRAVGLTQTARKVASGAAETVPVVRVTNLARTLEWLGERGFSRVGTSDQADKTLYDQSLTGNLALVMGGEAKGLRRLTGERCDALVALPMAGAVESLNVSVAAGICLYEARRQRSCTAAGS